LYHWNKLAEEWLKEIPKENQVCGLHFRRISFCYSVNARRKLTGRSVKASFLAREHKDKEKTYLVGLERSLQKLWLWKMSMPKYS